ncbi:hypothetical protein [Trichothermofontia sp.]
MSSPKVADMTVADLKALIRQVVREELRGQQSPPAIIDVDKLRETMASIDRHRWTPPPGTPTASQRIIEEREQWRQGM